MNSKITNALISLLLAFIIIMLLFFIASSAPDSGMKRGAELLGGRLPSGVIQGITYFLFFYGLLEILRMWRQVSIEETAFSMGLLPEKEQYILSADDVADIKLRMVDLGRSNPSILIDTIEKACTKFRANKSVAETLNVLNTQTDINIRNDDSEQSLIRYVAWAIPSVGFIGTVIGISASLGVANNVVTQEGINEVTSLLSIAFDTTLVALFLSLILTYFYHELQEKSEKLHAGIENYVLDNLVNRIYHR